MAGFIGSYLCEKLIYDGYNVIALDNFPIGNFALFSKLLRIFYIYYGGRLLPGLKFVPIFFYTEILDEFTLSWQNNPRLKEILAH